MIEINTGDNFYENYLKGLFFKDLEVYHRIQKGHFNYNSQIMSSFFNIFVRMPVH